MSGGSFQIADLFEALGDIFVGDLRIFVRHFEVLVFLELDLRKNLELGLEPQRLAAVEVDVRDIGRAHDAQVLRFELFLEKFGDQIFEDLLADVALKLLANQSRRRFAGTKARKSGFLLKRADNAIGLAFHGFGRDRDIDRMPATLYQCQKGFTSGGLIFIVAFRQSIRASAVGP